MEGVSETWHPIGRLWIGPVRFEQRMNGSPTGLWFDVPRWKWWIIKALNRAILWNLPLARRLWDRCIVEYRWIWIGKPGKA